VLLSHFKDKLSPDPLQFGLKSSSSCRHAKFTVKTVVDHYVRNGCTVTVFALDISKAFDGVGHYKMLNVLMDRLLFGQFVGLLSGWLAKCFVCVRLCYTPHTRAGFKF